MINEISGDEFTRLLYRTAMGSRTRGGAAPSDQGPTANCSVTAILDKDGMTLAQQRHLRECSFCARLAGHLNIS